MSVWPNWFLINDFFKGGGGDISLVGIFNKKGQINPNFINLTWLWLTAFCDKTAYCFFFLPENTLFKNCITTTKLLLVHCQYS